MTSRSFPPSATACLTARRQCPSGASSDLRLPQESISKSKIFQNVTQNLQRDAVGALPNFQGQLSKLDHGETVEWALDQDHVIHHDKTHDEAMTGGDDEPLFGPHKPQGTLDTDW